MKIIAGLAAILVYCTAANADTPDLPERPAGVRPDRDQALLSSSRIEHRNWSIDGLEREALVYLPEKPRGAPLLFGFHGHGGNVTNAARKFRLHELWPEAVVVYMQGVATPGKLTDPEGKKPGWQHAPGEQGDRDLAFFDAVLEAMRTEHGIDEARIYATGHSNGGGFTYLLWASRPGLFAAIAPSASASKAVRGAALLPLPVMHFAGRNDPLVRFDWQRLMMRQVCKVNRCGKKGEDRGDYCKSFSGGGGAPLVACIHDGGHEYPAFAPRQTVEFFRQNAKPTAVPDSAE